MGFKSDEKDSKSNLAGNPFWTRKLAADLNFKEVEYSEGRKHEKVERRTARRLTQTAARRKLLFQIFVRNFIKNRTIILEINHISTSIYREIYNM